MPFSLPFAYYFTLPLRAECGLDQHKQIASATFAQNSTINIPVSEKDLRSLQKRALAEGIPYPLFVSSILHKFIEGKLVEIGDRA